MKSKKQFSRSLEDNLERLKSHMRSLESSIESWNEDQTDNSGVINVLHELADFCEITSQPLNVDSVRAALAGRSLAGCLTFLERVPV